MTNKKRCAVAYLRVSTTKQGVSGLGIGAQREAVQRWADQHGYSIVREFAEDESGRSSDRPALAGAKAAARARRCTLVVAKLDRLSRDLDFIRALLRDDLDVAFCDLPDVPEGPAGKFILTQFAAVAELEAGLISQRTKAALKVKKDALAKRGKRLGNPNGAAALRRYHAGRTRRKEPHDNSAANVVRRGRADDYAVDVLREVEALRREGVTSLQALADGLNERGIASPRDGSRKRKDETRDIAPPRGAGRWHPASVLRVLRRAEQ